MVICGTDYEYFLIYIMTHFVAIGLLIHSVN